MSIRTGAYLMQNLEQSILKLLEIIRFGNCYYIINLFIHIHKGKPETLQRPLNQALYVLQIYFKITSQQSIFNSYFFFQVSNFFFLLYFMQHCSAEATMFLKIFLNNFLTLKKLKKTPTKLAYLWQLGGFFLCIPDCPKQPRTSFLFCKFFYTIVSAMVSECTTCYCILCGQEKSL